MSHRGMICSATVTSINTSVLHVLSSPGPPRFADIGGGKFRIGRRYHLETKGCPWDQHGGRASVAVAGRRPTPRGFEHDNA